MKRKTKRLSPKREVITSISPKAFINISLFVIGYLIFCFALGSIEKNISSKSFITKEVKASGNVIAPKVETKKEEPKKIESKKATYFIKLKNGNKEQNEAVEYLWNKTKNIDLILTFYGESYLLKDIVNKNKNGTSDYFECQLNSQYHMAFITEVKEKEISQKERLDYCINVWNDGIKKGKIATTFYAYSHRYEPRVRSQFWISQEAVNITYGIKK